MNVICNGAKTCVDSKTCIHGSIHEQHPGDDCTSACKHGYHCVGMKMNKPRQLNAGQKWLVNNWLNVNREKYGSCRASYLAGLMEGDLGFPVSTSSVLTIGQAMGVLKKREVKPKTVEVNPLNGAVMSVVELRQRIAVLEKIVEALNIRMGKQEGRLI